MHPPLSDEDHHAVRAELSRIVGGMPPECIELRPADTAGSYRALVAAVRDADDVRRFFVKDFGTSRLVKSAPARRRAREVRIYQDLLPTLGLGTARYHGVSWDSARNRYWLFLEHVGPTTLARQPFPTWVAAAGWLGRMQAALGRLARAPVPVSVLVRHDGDYFGKTAVAALEVVRRRAPDELCRVERAVRGYGAAIRRMTAAPSRVVHGSFRPDNVLIDGRAPHWRVCPVDWELAGWGHPLYDLAFLCDGFVDDKLAELLDAYRAALAGALALPAGPELQVVLRDFQVHKTLKALASAEERGLTSSAITRVVDRLAALEASRAA